MSAEKDAVMVAREIQDLAGSMTDGARAIAETVKAAVAVTVGNREMREGHAVQLQMPAPVIQLPAPQVEVVVNVPEAPAPTITVEGPTVNLPPTNINVEAAPAVAWEVTITRRDKDGYIQSFVVVPVEIRG